MGSSRLLAVLCAVAVIGLASAFQHSTDKDGIFKAIKALASTTEGPGDNMRTWLDKAVINAAKELRPPTKKVGDWVCPTADPAKFCDKVPDMYWRWMPLFMGSALPDAPIQWESPCFMSTRR
jgi:hypothetical protein